MIRDGGNQNRWRRSMSSRKFIMSWASRMIMSWSTTKSWKEMKVRVFSLLKKKKKTVWSGCLWRIDNLRLRIRCSDHQERRGGWVKWWGWCWWGATRESVFRICKNRREEPTEERRKEEKATCFKEVQHDDEREGKRRGNSLKPVQLILSLGHTACIRSASWVVCRNGSNSWAPESWIQRNIQQEIRLSVLHILPQVLSSHLSPLLSHPPLVHADRSLHKSSSHARHVRAKENWRNGGTHDRSRPDEKSRIQIPSYLRKKRFVIKIEREGREWLTDSVWSGCIWLVCGSGL